MTPPCAICVSDCLIWTRESRSGATGMSRWSSARSAPGAAPVAQAVSGIWPVPSGHSCPVSGQYGPSSEACERMIMPIPTGAAYADALDAQDPLAELRARFIVADPDLIYMDGNSLGRLPLATIEQATELICQQWGERLIRGWNEHWFYAPERIGARIAHLLGAEPDEVIVADSTSVNLFKLAAAALRYQEGRSQILTDNLNFPSDIYILQSACD